MPLRIILQNERAVGWNQLMRMHYNGRNHLVKEKKLVVLAAIRQLTTDVTIQEHEVDIHITAYMTALPLDSDNVCAKLYIDGLKGHVIQDDNRTYLRHCTTTVERHHEDCVVIDIWEADDGGDTGVDE
jgi:hypothetical protein